MPFAVFCTSVTREQNLPSFLLPTWPRLGRTLSFGRNVVGLRKNLFLFRLAKIRLKIVSKNTSRYTGYSALQSSWHKYDYINWWIFFLYSYSFKSTDRIKTRLSATGVFGNPIGCHIKKYSLVRSLKRDSVDSGFIISTKNLELKAKVSGSLLNWNILCFLLIHFFASPTKDLGLLFY